MTAAKLIKCAWRIAARAPEARTVPALVKQTRVIARTFSLTREEHEACATLALRVGPAALSQQLFDIEAAWRPSWAACTA